MPDPPPALWLKQSGLAAHTDQIPIFIWKDASIYGRDAENEDVATCPLIDASTFNIPVVVYTSTAFHTFPTFNLGGDFAVFAVAAIYAGGPGIHPRGGFPTNATGTNQGPLGFDFQKLTSGVQTGFFTVPAILPGGPFFLFTARRVGLTVYLYLNGTLLGSHTYLTPQVLSVRIPATVAAQIGGGGAIGLAELQVYSQALSDAGFAAITAGLRASYSL